MRMLGRALTFREGLILQIKDAQGNRGEGEIAPLTGVHFESLEDAEINLINILVVSYTHLTLPTKRIV